MKSRIILVLALLSVLFCSCLVTDFQPGMAGGRFAGVAAYEPTAASLASSLGDQLGVAVVVLSFEKMIMKGYTYLPDPAAPIYFVQGAFEVRQGEKRIAERVR